MRNVKIHNGDIKEERVYDLQMKGHRFVEAVELKYTRLILTAKIGLSKRLGDNIHPIHNCMQSKNVKIT